MNKIKLNGRNATANEVRDCVRALCLVRKELERDNEFVCIALNRLAFKGRIEWSTAGTVRDFIQRQLGRHGTLDGWITSRSDECMGSSEPAYSRAMQVTRQAWVDHMIRQYLALLPQVKRDI